MADFLVRFLERRGAATRERVARAASVLGIAANLLLFLLKLTVGLLFQSVSVTADAVNNLTDSASSIVTLVGFKLASKPADAEHPFGHARIEYLAGMIVSFLVIFLGLQLGMTAAQRIAEPVRSALSAAAFAALVLSILVKVLLMLFYRSVARQIRSEAMDAVSKDCRNDVVATAAVLVGAAVTRLSGVDLDGWLGAAVALFIVLSGVELIRETADPLLGLAPSAALIESVRARLLASPGVLGMHDLLVHSYGEGRTFASVHAEVDAGRTLSDVHEEIDALEREVETELGIHLVIHPDPVDGEKMRPGS